jgi:hypothetical protein
MSVITMSRMTTRRPLLILAAIVGALWRFDREEF